MRPRSSTSAAAAARRRRGCCKDARCSAWRTTASRRPSGAPMATAPVASNSTPMGPHCVSGRGSRLTSPMAGAMSRTIIRCFRPTRARPRTDFTADPWPVQGPRRQRGSRLPYRVQAPPRERQPNPWPNGHASTRHTWTPSPRSRPARCCAISTVPCPPGGMQSATASRAGTRWRSWCSPSSRPARRGRAAPCN